MKLYRRYGGDFFAIKSTESEGFVSLWDDGIVCVVGEDNVSPSDLTECREIELSDDCLYRLLSILWEQKE